MPAKNINLLTKVDFEKTVLGKFLRWSLTYGRYIIICTEIVVLLAFIYRFSLDRKITDLNDEIKQKSDIITANQEFEGQFRLLQSRVEQVSTLIGQQNNAYTLLTHLQTITPPGIQFGSFNVVGDTVTISATADTDATLASFVVQLKSSPLLTNVSIGGLSKKSTGTAQATFVVTAKIKSVQNANAPVNKPT